MLYEVIQWAAQLSRSVESQIPVKNVSDILLVLYVIAYMLNGKGRFLAAFLLCEISGVIYNLDYQYGYKLFIVYSVIYSILLLSLRNCKDVKTLLACAIMLLFDGIMAIDSYFYYEIETILYLLYLPVVVIIHLFLLCSLFKWRYSWSSMGRFIRNILDNFSASYNFTWICYNTTNLLKIKARK